MATGSSIIAAPLPQNIPVKVRLEFIDNLRWVMIVLVVAMHAAVTYSHLGSWYFMEDPKPGTGLTIVFATFQVFLQAFFMGLLFLVAGYFVPGACDRKGVRNFLRDRFVRLGVPSFLYMLLIHPLIVYGMLPTFVEPSRPTLRQAYLPYLTTSRVLSGSGPMWFALALLGFTVIYGMARWLAPGGRANHGQARLPNWRQVLGLAFFMGLASFLVRIVQPIGTNVYNMQLGFFTQYVLLFLTGICAWRRNWLLRIPYTFGVRALTIALTAGTLCWFLLVFALLTTHSENKLGGGFTWQSAVFSCWESFFCVGVCLGLIVLFREKLNRQGKLARWLSDNCFAVYLFHPPVLIAVTLALRQLEAPKLLKFACATVLATLLTYLASSCLLRRVPLLKRIL